jgi:hypothetical protein
MVVVNDFDQNLEVTLDYFVMKKVDNFCRIE